MTLFLISIYSYNYYDSIRPQPFTVQPHICGALFPTPAGRSLMKESIQCVDMSNVRVNQTLEHEENIQDRRAALWSLAHIAVQPKGIVYLEVFNNYDE